jgi:SOS-response transcriptional repressor LexA
MENSKKRPYRSTPFSTSLRELFKQSEWGAKSKCAKSIGKSVGYLSELSSGKKQGTEEVRRQIASFLGHTYEEMLSLGQWIVEEGSAEGWAEANEAMRNAMGAGFNSVQKAASNLIYKLNDPQRTQQAVIDSLPNTEAIAPLEMPSISQIPVISWVQAGAWSEIFDEFQPGDAEEWIMVFQNVSKNTFGLQITGDSMEPEFHEGEIIVVDPSINPETGKYVIAKIENGNGENGEATFKQFIRDGNQVFLKPLNANYPLMNMTGVDFKIVGCVVQKTKKY